MYLRGYAEQVPDFVILDKMFDERRNEKQSGRVYGCVEIKPFTSATRQGKDNRKLYSNYIRPIENWLENKEVVEGVEVVHEKLCQNRIKIEFESLEKKEEFIKKYSQGNKEPIPISLENVGIKKKVFLCGGNKDLCLQIEEKFEDNEIKQLKIQMQNDKAVLVPREIEKMECCNKIDYELFKELIGFKKVIFTNGYQWILMQCQCDKKFQRIKK